MVIKERNAIIAFTDRKRNALGASTSSDQFSAIGDEKKKSAVLELEEQRMEALRRRQEKEISKIVEREQTMVALQVKIAHTEAEEKKKDCKKKLSGHNDELLNALAEKEEGNLKPMEAYLEKRKKIKEEYKE